MSLTTMSGPDEGLGHVAKILAPAMNPSTAANATPIRFVEPCIVRLQSPHAIAPGPRHDYTSRMAEKKNTQFDRPGGYAQPKGATAVQRRAAVELKPGHIQLFGDTAPAHQPAEAGRRGKPGLAPAFQSEDPDTRLYVGDCRDVLAWLP